MKTKELTLLESVGNYYNAKTGYVYPIQSNLEPDLDMGMKISECSEEFIERLNKQDYNKIEKIHFLRY